MTGTCKKKKEKRKEIHLKCNENAIQQNVWEAAKAVLRRKCINLNI